MVEGLYPENFKEALEMKSSNRQATLYAGGTDWMVRHNDCEKLLFLNQIQELKEIVEDHDAISIGSGCTYFELIESNLVPEVLKEAIKAIAAPAIKNVGTIGGNICNASPAGDTLPVLYALGAKLRVDSLDTSSVVPIEEFILGIRKLSLKETEILKSIIIPKHKFTNVYYQKVGARKSQALSKLSFVGLADIKEGKIDDIRIAFGSVNTTVVNVKALEEKYIGLGKEEVNAMMANIKLSYDHYIKPIDDQRSTAAYRKKICMNLIEDFLKSLF